MHRLAFATALSVLIAAAIGVDAWLLVAGRVAPELIFVLLGMQGLVLLAAVWIGAAWLETRFFGPLGELQDRLSVSLRSDSTHDLDIGSSHGLGDLPASVAELARQLGRERRDTARAMDSAAESIEHRKSRLEAILRDLHEGVIVCNDDHRIVLFNQSAADTLGAAGPVGLHRPITSLMAGSRTRTTYVQLKEQYQDGHGVPPFATTRETTADGRDIELRMSLVVEPGGECSGYVLSFPGNGLERSRGGRDGVLADRPEFYDFSLFDPRSERRDVDRGLAELDYVVFDTETTGLRPGKGDAIVQISGVRLVNGKPTGEEFDTLVNPGMPIPPLSTRFHGITDDMVTGAPDAPQAVRSFAAFAEGAVLVAHNAAFDMKFLRMLEPRSRVVFRNAVLDTLLLSFIVQPNHTSHTLDAIAARFGVGIPDEARHTALGDARATAEIFLRMLPVLQRDGLGTLGRVLEASSRVFHIRRQQERF